MRQAAAVDITINPEYKIYKKKKTSPYRGHASEGSR